ncbi:MAG: HAD family phosphatase [Elusimicrobia bacterium]|nr:HAD family phosphatase [Elusimicrobiota bacterium]
MTNSAILGYKEWRMSLAGNSAYLSSLKSTLNFIPETVNETARFTARFIVTPDGTVIDRHNTSEADAAAAIADPDEETTPDLERQGNEAATTNGASSSSGILYSGIPVMAVEAFGKKIYNEAVRLFTKSVDTHAQDVLGRKLPLLTELRDIVTGDASRRLKEQALLRLHKQFNVFSAVIGHLPVESRNKFNALKQDDTQVAKFLYNLYSTGQLDNVLAGLNNHIPVDELSKQLEEITSTPEFDAARRKVYDETEVLPFDANDWQGYVETVQDVDKGLIEQLFRPAGWAAQSAADGKEDSKGNVYYENDIPVYYRNSKGDLSAHPVIILHQDVLSSRLAEAWADLLNKVGLSTGKGFKIPKGLVLALDENGRFKLVLQPGHRADLLNSKTGRKMKETIYSEGSLPVDLSTQYSTTDLLAVARLLEAGVKADFQLTLDAPSSFSLFVSLLGAFSGLGADTVMVGPFKEAAGPDNPAVPNAFGGVGYVTPRVAAATVDDMKTWGVSRSVATLLTVTLTTLVVSALMGINGLVPKEEFSLLTLAVPLLVLITGGSMIRSVIPLILNAYKDPRQRTAANLDVATWQQGSKLFMFLATAVWAGAGGKFVAVPIAAVLVLATLGLFFNTPAGRKVLSDAVTTFKEHPKESFKAMGKGSLILAKHLLKGFVEGVFAPVIWGGKKAKEGFKWASAKLKSSRATTAAQAGGETGTATTGTPTSSQSAEARYRAEYDGFFKKNSEVKDSLLRVTLAYASYAASLMLLNQLAEGPMNGVAQELFGVEGVGKWLTFAFASASFLVRLFASKWVKAGKFTDDQLTGISFVGMSLAALGLAVSPHTGTLGISLVALLGLVLYASTAVPGQLDQARLQNLVSATVQAQKNEVLQDKSLSQAEKEDKIADLEAKESKWAGWAKADYDKANANGIWGVYAAVLASIALPYFGIKDWSWIARSVFIYAGVVAGRGALKTGSHSLGFLRALSSKKKTLVVTTEDIAAGTVKAETFGVTDAGKANKLLPSLLKGKDSLKTLKEQLMPYGVVAISSEVKLTKVLKRLIQIHNRFVASAEKLGDEKLHASFEEVLAVAKDFDAVMKGSNVSESLRREFEKLLAALCEDGSLEQGVRDQPAYMEEGSFAMPSNYRNLLEARDIINELKQLATNIEQGGAAVNANTYSQFVQYHAEAKRLLQTYAAENPSESLIVRAEEERIRSVCLGLKNANVLRAHAGQTPAKDIQDLEDILRVYEGDMQISSEWEQSFQSEIEDMAGFFNAHLGLAQEVGLDEIIQGTGNAAALKISSQSELQALFIAPLEQALKLKQQGLPVDEATQSEIADLYQRADQAMTQYLNAHPKEEAEVVAMHKKLDDLYTQIIGEAPTKEKVAELAKKSSGLMSMVDWFGQLLEELLAWFKDGDDSPGANDGSGDLSALPSPGGGAEQLARLPGKKEVDAVIFDMDGTLLNTLGAWKNSTSNFLRSRGIEPPENIDAEMAALSLLEGARVLKERYGFKESPEELLEEVLATVRKFYEEDAMPKPGVPGVLQALKKQGIKICVATASNREFAEAAFKRTGLMEYIDFIITCDEVGVGKHNPLVYETALKKLGTNRKRTLVVEDALYALQTAKKAGFPTAGVYETSAEQAAFRADANYCVDFFHPVQVGG